MNRSSISDDNVYRSFCETATKDDNVFKTFRNDPKYQIVLEHVSKQQGEQYLNLIKRDNAELLQFKDKFITNDKIGNPPTYDFGDFGYVSPTTLRYIKVLSDLIKEHGSLDKMDIVEIGGGYGGQAKIIMDMYNVNSYTLIDLPPVLLLIKKYLNSYDSLNHSKIHYKSINDLDDKGKYDLAISNYAYTECVKSVQKEYYDKVLSKANKGYITANFINNIFNLDYHTKDELLEMFNNSSIKPEEPKTHANNIILLWK